MSRSSQWPAWRHLESVAPTEPVKLQSNQLPIGALQAENAKQSRKPILQEIPKGGPVRSVHLTPSRPGLTPHSKHTKLQGAPRAELHPEAIERSAFITKTEALQNQDKTRISQSHGSHLVAA